MSKDDYAVIAYKILAYYYACLKRGVEGSITKAQELAGCNDTYFLAVFQDLIGNGYMSGEIEMDYTRALIGTNLCVTLKGTEFLDTNSAMTKAKKALGKAFEAVLQAAVAATSLL